MIKCTKKFITSANSLERILEIFSVIENAMNVYHIYYYENNLRPELIKQKVNYTKGNVTLPIRFVVTFTHKNVKEIVSQATN